MKYERIEAFLAVADELHFGRAAERLMIDASQVTRRIQELERWIGVALFVRSSRKVELTRDGAALVEGLRAHHVGLMNALEDARRRARSADGDLVIGFTEAIVAPEVDWIVDELQARHPECRAQLIQVPILSQFDALVGRDIDTLIGWIEAAPPGVEVGAVIGERARALAMARRHPLAMRAQVSVEDFADHVVSSWGYGPLMDRMRLAFCPDRTPSGRPIERGGPRVQTLAELANAIAAGHVIHPTIEGVMMFDGHPGIRVVPVMDLTPLHLGLMVRAETLDPRVNALISIASEGTSA